MATSIDETYKGTDNIELDLLLEAINKHYCKSFVEYARSSVMRRVMRRKNIWNLTHISEMIPLIMESPAHWQTLFTDLSTSVTEMYRDPPFYSSLVANVFPLLATFPFFKIWHVGCATGEEVYSLAILLHEHGLLERAQIYGTDFNDNVLAVARDGIYNQEAIAQYQAIYQSAGGQHYLQDYFHLAYGKCRVKSFIKKKITFANHNLTHDGSFGEMELILCRNVLIYFNRALKERAIRLFDDSLYPGGFLALGSKESLSYIASGDGFRIIDKSNKIYKKVNQSKGLL